METPLKVAKQKSLCWEHGNVWHLLDGTEDGIFNFGLCAKCMVVFVPNAVQRRRLVRAMFGVKDD